MVVVVGVVTQFDFVRLWLLFMIHSTSASNLDDANNFVALLSLISLKILVNSPCDVIKYVGKVDMKSITNVHESM
jgi:hypothetical protein